MSAVVQSQETVLVVEDDVLIRMPIAQYLRDCGYKVIEAANGDEAMAVLSHKETVVDVVFTDIEMPGALDGFGLAKWTRHRTALVSAPPHKVLLLVQQYAVLSQPV
jgi:CheY-like chemotaxis protein